MELINTIYTSRTWTRHGLKIAYAISGLLLLASAASIAWHIRTQGTIKTTNYSEQSIKPISKKPKHSYRINDIVRANLFGNPNPEPVAKLAPKKTTLDLTLQGVLAATDDSMARAIIMSGKKKAKLYSVGESIKGASVSIEEIKVNEVLLNRNGAIESLSLRKQKGKGNNSIITYSNNNSDQISGTNASIDSIRNASRVSRSTRKSRPESAQARKVKKPNFSGLDRALKKINEI